MRLSTTGTRRGQRNVRDSEEKTYLIYELTKERKKYFRNLRFIISGEVLVYLSLILLAFNLREVVLGKVNYIICIILFFSFGQ